MSLHKDYVLGFVICMKTQEVLLIEKQKPEFQKGFYTGIGGKVEANDTDIYAAMSRECAEECGLKIFDEAWSRICVMDCDSSIDKVSTSWTVHVLAIIVPPDIFNRTQQLEEEKLKKFYFRELTISNSTLLGNITWLLGMSIDKLINKSFEVPTIKYTGLSLPIKFPS